MVLSGEPGAVFENGEKIGSVPVARNFRGEQQYVIEDCGCGSDKQSAGHRVRSAIRSLRMETVQTELQLSLRNPAAIRVLTGIYYTHIVMSATRDHCKIQSVRYITYEHICVHLSHFITR